MIFSMVESVKGDARLEAGMAYMYEWLGIPYTGAPPLALSLTSRRHARRSRVQAFPFRGGGWSSTRKPRWTTSAIP